jgi:hypothetical protein
VKSVMAMIHVKSGEFSGFAFRVSGFGLSVVGA